MNAKPKKKSEKQIVSDFNDKYNSRDGGAGKGDAPRSTFSDQYKKNYDSIFRKNPNTKKNIKTKKG
jgi:hypothetical protein